MTFDYSILQKNLHDLRIENRISQADLAKELGFSRHTYLNYETGIRIPTLDAIRHISAYYQISIDDLLERPQILKVQEPLKRGPKAKKKPQQ